MAKNSGSTRTSGASGGSMPQGWSRGMMGEYISNRPSSEMPFINANDESLRLLGASFNGMSLGVANGNISVTGVKDPKEAEKLVNAVITIGRTNKAFQNLDDENDTNIEFNGGRVVLSERDTRDFSQTESPWIIQGGRTIHADFDNGLHISKTYSTDGTRYTGVYTSREDAINAMREEVLKRIKNLSN